MSTDESSRLAAAVRELAGTLPGAHGRAQLHAVAALVEHLRGPLLAEVPEAATLGHEIDAAMADGDEAAAIAAARRLAAAEAGRVRIVDWEAVSGG